tara:strand:- start:697 stop:1368 length:672 start_codon:yes stop_codon:yes gene_type:complete
MQNLQEINSIQTEKTISIFQLIESSGIGGIIIIGILFILLIMVIYIYFERLFAIKSASIIDKDFMPQIRTHILKGKIDNAKSLCQSIDTPVARLLEKGVSRIGRPLEDINSALENSGKIEIYKLEKNVSILATISGVAPMIGFLGTVIGMILSIFEIANAGGNIDMQLLSNGLYTAMTTTVAGLVVGIIGYIAYNHLVVKTNKIIYQMEAISLEFFDLLNEPA